MNRLEARLKEMNSGLLNSFHESLQQVKLLLAKFSENFPTYTDHSLEHTYTVLQIASEMLTKKEIENLNAEEIYILCMSSILHDIGMCIPEDKLLANFKRYEAYQNEGESSDKEKRIRDIHHELSHDFIVLEWVNLKIPNEKYADAIARVAMGHRKVQLDDPAIYPTKFFVKGGRDFVCLPYLASVLRLADELDITNLRTPDLLTKYYMPNNEISINEWKKHIATTQVNYTEDRILFEVKCSDQNSLAALESQFEKIQDVSNYCQKIVRNISNVEERAFELRANKIETNYTYLNFDPKGIQFSFNVKNVVNTFIGKDLYKSELSALREVLQNSVDSCRYKISLGAVNYVPEITIDVQNEKIVIHDNGLGMDEFIIENFFGKLGSSFYSDLEVQENYDAIGQFGVGVFSYFLLGDFIDIETKTEKGESLKFRIDKDPKNYFHFFEDSCRENSGTSITLPLKEEIQNKFSFNDFVDYIENTFSHIEFPIILEGGAQQQIIGEKKFDSPKKLFVEENIRFQYSGKIEEIGYVNVRIDDEFVNGEITLLLNKLDKENVIAPISEYFNYESYSPTVNYGDSSKVRISQKGVFVNNYAGDLLKHTIGSINIQKSVPINISRNEFSNESEIENIINEFEICLIANLFMQLQETCSKESMSINTYNFVRYCMHYYMIGNLSKEHKAQFTEIADSQFFIKVFSQNEFEYLCISDFISKNSEFLIVTEDEDLNVISNKFKVPLIVTPIVETDFETFYYFFSNLFIQHFSYRSHLIYDKLESFLAFSLEKDQNNEIENLDDFNKFTIWSFSNLISFDKDFIATSYFLNKKAFRKEKIRDRGLVFNREHWFMKFILENYKGWLKDSHKSKVIKASAEVIGQIVFKKVSLDKGLQILNDSILALGNNKIKFSAIDFEAK